MAQAEPEVQELWPIDRIGRYRRFFTDDLNERWMETWECIWETDEVTWEPRESIDKLQLFEEYEARRKSIPTIASDEKARIEDDMQCDIYELVHASTASYAISPSTQLQYATSTHRSSPVFNTGMAARDSAHTLRTCLIRTPALALICRTSLARPHPHQKPHPRFEHATILS